MRCATTNDELVAFRTDFSYGTQPARDYSLDELVTLARDVLRDAGRPASIGQSAGIEQVR